MDLQYFDLIDPDPSKYGDPRIQGAKYQPKILSSRNPSLNCCINDKLSKIALNSEWFIKILQ